MTRNEWTSRFVTVSHVAVPLNRESGPHLRDLRKFVTECHGLPDDVLVRVDPGPLGEGGRRNVELSVRVETREGGEA